MYNIILYNFIFNTNTGWGGDGEGSKEIYLNHVIHKNINGWVPYGWRR